MKQEELFEWLYKEMDEIGYKATHLGYARMAADVTPPKESGWYELTSDEKLRLMDRVLTKLLNKMKAPGYEDGVNQLDSVPSDDAGHKDDIERIDSEYAWRIEYANMSEEEKRRIRLPRFSGGPIEDDETVWKGKLIKKKDKPKE